MATFNNLVSPIEYGFNTTAPIKLETEGIKNIKWPTMLMVNNPPVTIETTYIMDDDIIRNNPQEAEIIVREKLAKDLAKKLLEEDLIDILTNHDISAECTTFKAKLKILQG